MSGWAITDSIAEHLAAALAPYQPEGLLSRDARRRIDRQICGRLPAAMTAIYGFECRLWEEAPEGDFLVCSGPSPEHWAALHQIAAERTDEAWQRLAQFLGQAGDAFAPRCAEIHNMWLEFDLVGAAENTGDLPRPSVFLGTDHLRAMPADASGDLPLGAEWLASALTALRGNAPSASQRRALARLLAALPPDARLFQIGTMLSREEGFVRVCARGLKVEEIELYAQAAGWPGDRQQLAAAVARLRPLVDEIRLDFDLQDEVQAPLGLECYITEAASLAERTTRFLQELVSAGLCLPQKASGLAAWFGLTHERRYRDLWPPALLARKAALGLQESSTFRRWVHHIKITLRPGESPRAKAYLAVAPAFISDAALKAALAEAR